MRCLALAQAWQEHGGRAIFATQTNLATIVTLLQSSGITVASILEGTDKTWDIAETIALARQEGVDAVVLDGYYFGEEFEIQSKKPNFP